MKIQLFEIDGNNEQILWGFEDNSFIIGITTRKVIYTSGLVKDSVSRYTKSIYIQRVYIYNNIILQYLYLVSLFPFDFVFPGIPISIKQVLVGKHSS